MPHQARRRESNACAFRLRGFTRASALGIGLLAPLAGAVDAATVSAPPISIDGSHTSVAALERNGVVLVPARGFFEKLGATVTSTPASFVATRDGKKLAVLAVGSRTATIDGEARTLPFAPFVSAGNVMIPLRLVSEAAGASVAYSSSPHSVSVTRAAAGTKITEAGSAAGAGAGAAAVAQAAAPAAAPAATDVASAAPVADTQTNQSGIPWWVWALLALLVLALIGWAVTRRKKEPIITTSSTARNNEPIVTTASKHDEPTITTRK